ncbi:MAG: glycoside hydrolase family 3 C-terminal domain-containing protein [Eggerthellaceae bacterium]|nr:glycoside hydrolase family 3 C-terminal domain-containing protein [Eggerthellaceae bacterium]
MQETFAHETDEVTPLEEAGRDVALQAARESIVLLENDGTLPLEPCRIALYGAGAAMTIAGGTGSGEVNVRHCVSVREGLESAGFEITTTARLDAYERAWHEGRVSFIAAQRAKIRTFRPSVLGELLAMEYHAPEDDPITAEEAGAQNTDTCIYVLSRISGEGLDRTDAAGNYQLTSRELDDIRMCACAYAKTIVVLNVGAPIDVMPICETEGVNALVHMGLPGMEGGHALADVLTGAVSPSGKLAVSWPRSLSHIPFSSTFGTNADDLDVADYKEGVYVGYRYYTSFDVEPAYPFGYGLGYAKFQQELTSVRLDGQTITATVRIRNMSAEHAGKSVVQLYASLPQGVSPKERMRLVAFEKTRNLMPGESCEAALTFSLRDLASYDEADAETVLDQGSYALLLGESSASTRPVAAVRVSGRFTLERHENLCSSKKAVVELCAPVAQPCATDGLPVVTVCADHITPVVHHYGKAANTLPEIEAIVAALSDKQKADLCVGTGLMGSRRGFSVPGAVGHTTTALLEAGIPNVELCDGPAGIRLQRRSAVDAKGVIRPLDPPLSIYEVLPRFITRLLYGNPDRDKVVYQFVTGFPAASSVAQTWNADLAQSIGKTVGAEMQAYGVTYWLAPALNIVRHPLCGRNFEYYSEDPVVSGKMAAAVTSGVQSVPGCFACCKHFAANNQETNRNTMSANVDERVLREIYLRGFEIAVREAKPASIMSAYNKINDTYCSENAELLQGILRDEWGFDGIVMTDWFATGFGHASEAKALMAGVNLIMPGGMGAKPVLLHGLTTKTVTQKALDASCARVLAKTLAARPT